MCSDDDTWRLSLDLALISTTNQMIRENWTKTKTREELQVVLGAFFSSENTEATEGKGD